MEGKYTLFKTSEGIFTVPILAEKNIFKMKLDGHELSFRASIERYFIYYLYVYPNKGEVIGWLREIGKFDWSSNKYDRFIDEFIKLHPKTSAPEYSLELVPMQADKEEGLELPIPYYCPKISLQGEKELMQIIKDAPRSEIRNKMISWFMSYCRDYGYSFAKKCRGAQYDWLYESYLEQHALSKLNPRPVAPEEIIAAKAKRKMTKRNDTIRVFAKILIYLIALVLFGYLSYVVEDFWISTGCMIVFLCLLGFPFYLIKL